MPNAALTHPLPGPAWSAPVVAFAVAQTLLLGYSCHRYVLLWRWWRARRRPPAPVPSPPRDWPVVTVQLPLYNEPVVAERLIDAVAALRYPPDRLEIQVLDDSTDGTTATVARAVRRHRARGVDIRLVHRRRREGYKAGALAAGLRRSRGEFLAVFDADFVPPSDLLERLVPHFADPAVGMVQARWSHLNRDRSRLTAAQAVMLDAHFLVEHWVRMRAGLFFNFNGAAGVWRRTCIESAGGWSHDTLTEDLDLSYRAQLGGWRFVFVPTAAAPAELPGDVRSLKSQQHRWVKGSVQTARKLLPRLLAAPLPWRLKAEAILHLTSNAAYPLLLALSLLLLPVLLATAALPPALTVALQVGVLLGGVVPVSAFLALGQAGAGRSRRRIAGDVVGALVLGVGLSLNNSRAVVEGLGRRTGAWERTPKTGDGGSRKALETYAPDPSRAVGIEMALALYFAAVSTLALSGPRLPSLPFLLLLVAGFGAVGGASLRRGGGAARPLRAG